MKKGEIFWGRKNSDAIHPIVFLEHKDSDNFIGAMLTKSAKFSHNILMNPNHFKVEDASGSKYQFEYKNTHFVKAKLIKKNEWMPFTKIGELTDEGISFIESHIDSEPEKYWEEL